MRNLQYQLFLESISFLIFFRLFRFILTTGNNAIGITNKGVNPFFKLMKSDIKNNAIKVTISMVVRDFIDFCF
ncbi:hypothetical protein BAX95_01025 [Elizabethkingia meningoseptica]|nr:hypothetical protein BES09_08285 [Elizabethkingia meningoseptica]OHT29409.1 hypothetical protein BFF93_08295 [Elizabethkingia meningoseptica]OPC08544.1 hypothetical protein BAX93_13720 [Elizabethkingia meningoseptica]OPC25525.1 hypothetical protein BAX95_01025 [Elizabethkingia meningoseptica]